MTLESDNKYVRSDSVVARVIGGETLVVPIHGNVGDLASVYSFNETGSKIWEALASPMSVEELAHVVESHFVTTAEDARAHIETFLEETCAKGIVKRLAVSGAER
jgi:coenzyme PQQ synthesis protein D (PqqD)